MRRGHPRGLSVVMVLLVCILLKAGAAAAGDQGPAAPTADPPRGVFVPSREVKLLAEPEAEIYYTLDGGNPYTLTDGRPTVSAAAYRYTGPFTLFHTTTVRAAAYRDGLWSPVVSFRYTNLREMIESADRVLDRLAKLSPEQMEYLVGLLDRQLDILWGPNGQEPVLTESQQTLLASNGITPDNLREVKAAFEAYIAGHYSGGQNDYAGFVQALQEPRDFDYLQNLYLRLRDTLSPAFRQELVLRGSSVEELLDCLIRLVDLNLAAGLAAVAPNTDLQKQARDIFNQTLVQNSNLTLAILSNNGLNFANAQKVIERLSQEDRNRVNDVLWTMGYFNLTGLTVSPDSLALTAGQTADLTATAIYGEAWSRDVTGPAAWSSDSPSVASVAYDAATGRAVVTAAAPGSASITVTYGEGTVSLAAHCVVTVVAAPPRYALSLTTDKPTYRFGLDPVTLSGTLTRDGAGLGGVQVTLALLHQGVTRQVLSLSTDASGGFRLTLPPGAFDRGGTWEVAASAGALRASASFTLVADVEADPPPGTYPGPVTVTLRPARPEAEVYYTTDGTDPRASATRLEYRQPFTLTVSTTVTAATYLNGLWSEPVPLDYRIVSVLVPAPGRLSSDVRQAFAGGRVALTVPAGTNVGENARIEVEVLDRLPSEPAGRLPQGVRVAGSVVNLNAEGLTLPEGALFTLELELPPDQTERAGIYLYDGSAARWVYLPTTRADRVLRCGLAHFSLYAVLADTAPPASVTLTPAEVGRDQITLSMGAEDFSGVAGFRVYRAVAGEEGSEVEIGYARATDGVASYADAGPAGGLRQDVRYHYRVRAVDVLGNESAFSDPLTLATDALLTGRVGLQGIDPERWPDQPCWAGVWVELLTDAGQRLAVRSTGGDGGYGFNRHPDTGGAGPGTYILRARASRTGYLSRSQTVEWSGDLDLPVTWLPTGDLNGDSRIDGADLAELEKYLDATFTNVDLQAWSPHADLNRDNRVDLLDLLYLGLNWDRSGE